MDTGKVVDAMAKVVYLLFANNEKHALNIMRSEKEIKTHVWDRALLYAAAKGNVVILNELYEEGAEFLSLTPRHQLLRMAK